MASTVPGGFRIHPLVALAVGGILWYFPAIVQPLARPIGQAMRALGLLDAGTGESVADFQANLVLRWAAVALLLAFILTVERRPLSSVGVRAPRWRDVFLAVGLGLLSLVVTMVLFSLLVGTELDSDTQTAQITTTLSLGGLVHLSINAAIVEELFYRGFLMERIIDLTGRPWLAALVSYLLFVAIHVAGSGWTTVLAVNVVGSALIVGLYWLRRNLFLCIIVHAVGNLLLFAGLLSS